MLIVSGLYQSKVNCSLAAKPLPDSKAAAHFVLIQTLMFWNVNQNIIMLNSLKSLSKQCQLQPHSWAKACLLFMELWRGVLLCKLDYNHVIAIYPLSQPASEKHNQEKIPTNLCTPGEFPPKKCLPCLIIIQSCYFDYRTNKPFTCSGCVICILCSVHLISTYYVHKRS